MAIFAKQFGMFYGGEKEVVQTRSLEWVNRTNYHGMHYSAMHTLKEDADEPALGEGGPGGKAIPPHFLKQLQRTQRGERDG